MNFPKWELFSGSPGSVIFLQSLKETLARLVPEKRLEVQEFRKQHNDTKIGDVTVGMVNFQISILYQFF